MGRPVVHFEIGCRNRARTGDFYSKLFGWQITAADPASSIQTGSPQGISGHITSLGHQPEHYTLRSTRPPNWAASRRSGPSRFPPVRLHGSRIRTGTPSGY
jgi:hypothetical protein